jgi:hypothetical protein
MVKDTRNLSHLITPEYQKLVEEVHENNPEWGKTFIPQIKNIYALIQRYNATTILDYGSGKGWLAKSLPFLEIRSYDPCVPEFAATPEPADFVICARTLEHVEPECVDAVLKDLKRCTENIIYFEISYFPSAENLSDGRNSHLIQKDASFWLPKLTKHFTLKQCQQLNNFKWLWFLGTKK